MSEWIPLTVAAGCQLSVLLDEVGLPKDDWNLTTIFAAVENRETLKKAPRPAYLLHPGEVWFVPPPPLPDDAVMADYACLGSEKTTDDVVAAIKARHGEGSASQLTVEPAAFTSSYLLGLAHNRDFRLRREAKPPAPIEPGETVRYPSSTRRTRPHDVSPSTSLSDSTTTLPTGALFDVTVKLAESGQVLKLIEPQTDLRTGGELLSGVWRGSRIRFEIDVQPRVPGAKPTELSVHILRDGTSYFNQLLPWTETGPRFWEWDGFTLPPPGPGELDVGIADTEILRGSLTVDVTAYADVGVPGRGALKLANRAVKAPFLDVKVDLGSGRIDATAWVSFNHALEDEGLWLFAMLSALIATVGVVAVEAAVMGFDAAGREEEPMPGSTQLRYMGLMLGTAGGMMASAAILTASLLGARKLSQTDFDALVGNIRAGIGVHWSRNISLNGVELEFRAQTRVDSKHPAIRFALMDPLQKDARGVNLSMVMASAPIVVANSPYPRMNERTGAHELGHSVLEAAVDTAWSIEHKGSSGGMMDQDAKTVAEGGFAPPPAPARRDLMIYYDDPRGPHPIAVYDEQIDRTEAAATDVLGWIASTQIEFVEI